MGQVGSFKYQYQAETLAWQNAVLQNGGAFEYNTVFIINDFIKRFKVKNYYRKFVYLLPMMGQKVAAACAPLVNILNVANATNHNFVDADFNQTTGLQGDGSTKYLDSLINGSQLGVTNNGGLGYWETNISFGTNVEPVGAYNSAVNQRFVLDLRNNIRAFRWGVASNGGGDSSAATNGHYYGQRPSATERTCYFNGLSIGTNNANDTTSGLGDQTLVIVGSHEIPVTPWPGRCGCAYFTDGTLTTDEITDFHNLLAGYLMAPSKKI